MHTFDDQVVIPNLSRQLGLLFEDSAAIEQPASNTYFSAPTIDIDRRISGRKPAALVVG